MATILQQRQQQVVVGDVALRLAGGSGQNASERLAVRQTLHIQILRRKREDADLGHGVVVRPLRNAVEGTHRLFEGRRRLLEESEQQVLATDLLVTAEDRLVASHVKQVNARLGKSVAVGHAPVLCVVPFETRAGLVLTDILLKSARYLLTLA